MPSRILVLCALSFCLLLTACGGGGGGGADTPPVISEATADSDAKTKTALAGANLAIEKLKQTITSGRRSRDAKGLLRDLETTQAALKNIEEQRALVDKQLEEVRQTFIQVATLTANLQNDKALLQKDKEALTEETRKLEKREATLTTQFYAAVTTALVALGAVFIKLPSDILDRRYKRLEIKLKSLELEKLQRAQEIAPHPATLLTGLRSVRPRKAAGAPPT